MSVSRRDMLRAGALAGAGVLLSGCTRVAGRLAPPPKAAWEPPNDDPGAPHARLLNRGGFGPSPADMARLDADGVERYIDEQLRPDGPEPRHLAVRLRGIEALRSGVLGRRDPAAHAMELRDYEQDDILVQLQQAAILRAVYSTHQLRERMADLWSNHFNVYARKEKGAHFKPADDLAVVRRHALGRFPDMLRASAHSPAMLGYLDNQRNRRGVPNENYARELLELHTLGVHGGYTQKDVQEVARCFTGWTVEDRFLQRRGAFRFDPDRHDDGAKTVLGVRLPPGGGQQDGAMVLDILARHPATARNIAEKICRTFLGEHAGPWPDRLAALYRRTEGDIPSMLRPLLLSPDLLAAPPLLKRPFDFMVSALRAVNADTDGGRALHDHLQRMGQPLYQWPMPDGYPDKTAAWTGSLLARWNFAFALARGGLEGTAPDANGLRRAVEAAPQPGARLIELLLQRPASAQSLQPLRAALDARSSGPWEEAAALILCAPAFQWR